MHRVFSQIESGPLALDAALACDLSELTADELVRLNRLAQDLVRKATALGLAAMAEASRAEAHKNAGELSMTALVAKEAGVSRREAAQQVRLAQQLDAAPVLRESLGRAGMSTDKARIVSDALQDLPADLTAEERRAVECDLTAAAPDLPLEQLRRKARRAVEVVDVHRADTIENRQVEQAERRQATQVSFWMSRPDAETGMVKGGFEVDAVTGDVLRSLMDSATSPRKQDGAPDRPHAQGEAFVQLVRHLPKDGFGNHGGIPATLVVTVDEATLRGSTDRAGVTEHGTTVSAGQLRRLACDAGILPAVMGSGSKALDLGREERYHSVPQRRALALRDLGCAFPGCDRPPGWCESHHLVPWSRGGPTTVDDGVLLCSRHHHEVHDRGWELRLHPIDRIVEFRRRPAEPWRRNHHYRPLTLTG
ncbi:HNH endonuclease [Aeromicrobium choanae]|uniref:HNH endonuclease n=1 Tax=Aeromicrobium choanae TaxID=1736691 RepID=A0A1T4Z1U7_9ACTN|nr:HNH endonuclease [Aeromicrobium choanae]